MFAQLFVQGHQQNRKRGNTIFRKSCGIGICTLGFPVTPCSALTRRPPKKKIKKCTTGVPSTYANCRGGKSDHVATSQDSGIVLSDAHLASMSPWKPLNAP